MLKTIIHNSPQLVAFLLALNLKLSRPQFQHVLTVADGLIVGEGDKNPEISA